MAVHLGQRFLLRGSLPQMVMSYAVSEPGEWTAREIAEDIEVTIYVVSETLRSLRRRGMVLIDGKNVYPTESGKQVLFRSLAR